MAHRAGRLHGHGYATRAGVGLDGSLRAGPCRPRLCGTVPNAWVDPHRLTGAALETYVQASVEEYRQLARELGLWLWKTGTA